MREWGEGTRVRASRPSSPRLDPMARIKGTNLVHTQSFIDSVFGLEGWASVGAELPRETRLALESVVAVGWYPARLHTDLLHAIDRALGPSHPGILARAGAYSAEYDVTRIHRILFRVANPGVILEKTSEIWARFFDTGTWTVERPTSTTTVSTLRDFEIVDSSYCAYLCGYFVRMFELIGAEDVHLAHPLCRARGDDVCRFDGSWR